MKKNLLTLLKFLAFLGVGLTILYLVYQNQKEGFEARCELQGQTGAECDFLGKIKDDFLSVNVFWILMVLVAYTLSNVSRALRWQMLLRPLGYKTHFFNAFGTVVIGYLANLGLPRMGEFVRAGMMSRYEKIPAEKVMGTIVIGRTVDVICLLLVFLLTFAFEYEAIYDYFNQLGSGDTATQTSLFQKTWVQIVLALGVIGGIILLIFRKKIQQTKLYEKVINLLLGLWEGMKTVVKMKNPWLFIGHSIFIWVMYFFMTYLCFWAFGATENLPATAGLVVFAFGALGIVIPAPGGMGSYQFLVVEALSIYMIPDAEAFSFANILFFSIQIGGNFITGLICLLALQVFNRSYEPAPPVTTTSVS